MIWHFEALNFILIGQPICVDYLGPFGNLFSLGLIWLFCLAGNNLQVVLHVVDIIMCKRNKFGPRDVPCGTPESESACVHEECFPSTTSCWLICFRKLPSIYLIVLLFIPYCFNLSRSISCDTESKAFAKSKMAMSTLYCINSCSVAINCASHEYPNHNPCWSMVSIFCLAKCPNMCLHSIQLWRICFVVHCAKKYNSQYFYWGMRVQKVYIRWLCSIYMWVILACNFLPWFYSLSWQSELCYLSQSSCYVPVLNLEVNGWLHIAVNSGSSLVAVSLRM